MYRCGMAFVCMILVYDVEGVKDKYKREKEKSQLYQMKSYSSQLKCKDYTKTVYEVQSDAFEFIFTK